MATDTKNFVKNATSIISKNLTNFEKQSLLIIDDLGIEKDILDETFGTSLTAFTADFTEKISFMLDMLQDYQSEVHTGIDTVSAEITLHCQKLSLDPELFLSDQKAKSKQYEELKTANLKLQKIMNDRQKQWLELQQLESDLLRKLGAEDESGNFNNVYRNKMPEIIPSEDEIETYDSHVEKINVRVQNRTVEFRKIQTECINTLTLMEEIPDHNFGKRFINIDEFEDLSNEYYNEIKKFQSYCQYLLTERKTEIDQLLKRVSFILERLELTEDDLSNDPSRSNLTSLVSRLEKLEIIKRKKMDEIIEKTQVEIDSWNLKCWTSDLQKLKFQSSLKAISDKDQLLEAMEVHLNKLKDKYSEYEDFYKKFEAWLKNFNEKEIFEEDQKDPKRLNNRGGALLQAQKKRATLKKRISKYERDLMEMMAQRELPLLKGTSVDEFIANEYERVDEDQKYKQEVKKCEKEKQTFQESRFGVDRSAIKTTPRKRLGGAQGGTGKRLNTNVTNSTASSGKNTSKLTTSTTSASRGRQPLSSKPTPSSSGNQKFQPRSKPIFAKPAGIPQMRNFNTPTRPKALRRSVTPDRLYASKPAFKKLLPSQVAKSKNGFGFNPRRRSNSQSQLADKENRLPNIPEKVSEGVSIFTDDEILDFTQEISQRSKQNSYLTSSFVQSKTP